jgi:Fe2+ transport system protein B
MSNVKYNIILLIKHKNLIREHDSINSEVDKIKAQLDKNKYDKKTIMEEIQKLNSTITKFESKRNEMMHSIVRNEETKNILLNLIKIFFITLLIITIIALSIIGIVSFFVIRSQRRYHILHEEKSQDNIEVENGKPYINELGRIKAKNVETDSTDRKKIISKISNEDKKTEIENNN